MKVFVIILNFNGKKDTLKCLTSVKQLSVISYQLSVVVVDNGSTDDSVEVIKKTFPEVKVLENKKNLGFAEGNNVGIRYALENDADWVLVLNNDTLVDKKFLIHLIKLAKKDERVGILAPKIYFAPGFEFHRKRYKRENLGRVIWYAGGRIDWQNILGIHDGVDHVDWGQFDKEKEVEFISGCCMLVKREVFEKIGLFDKKYYLYFEDADFCLRAKSAGFKLLYVPKAIIWHKNAVTSGGSGSALQEYYYTRNRLLFCFKYASLRTKIALMRESVIRLLKGKQWERRGIIDFLAQRFRKGSYLSN